MAACAVLAGAAVTRWWVLATVDGRTPYGALDLVVRPHHAAFWQALGFDFDIGVSILLLLPVLAVVAVTARYYIRTVSSAIGIGLWAGAGLANGLELVATGAVVDYLAIRLGATGLYAVTNLPDLVAVTSVIVLGVCLFRVDVADRRARRAERARAGPPA